MNASYEYQGVHVDLRPKFECGCPRTCDSMGLARMSENFVCEGRIRFHMNNKGRNETEACAAAAEEGACGMECHPARCHDEAALRPAPFNWTRVVHLERPPKPFTRYDGVVVANKVHSPADMQKVKQMICLFTAAYNRHVNYDIVVFSTLPWRHWQVEELRSVAPETKITVVRDSAPLQDHIASMTPEEVAFLHKRCDVKEGEKLTWFNWCTEEDAVTSRLNYIWQAEFRAYHLWKTKALADYKYMVRPNALFSGDTSLRHRHTHAHTLTHTLARLLAYSHDVHRSGWIRMRSALRDGSTTHSRP
jgi:hypothetical protein